MTLTPAAENRTLPESNKSGGEIMGYTGGRVYQRGNRFYVEIYWNKKVEKFWSVLIQGEWHAIKSRENGEKLLSAIREAIDRDRDGFDPRSFRKENPLRLGEYYKTWLKDIAGSVTKGTIRDYKTAVVRYAIPFFGADKNIGNFHKAELLRFHTSLLLSDKGKFNVLSSLKTMVRWAYGNEEIRRMPPFPKVTKGELPEIQYLTLEQQEKILTCIPHEDAPIFRFAMEYGLRIGEVCAIQPDAISDGKVTIRRAFSGNILNEKTKTGAIRSFELTPYAQSILNGLPRIGPFVFIRQDGRPYNNEILNRIWHEAEKASGIRIKLYNAVRHSLGCQLLDEGHDMSFVQQVLGHRKQEMTQRYAKRTAKRVGKILSMRRFAGSVAGENAGGKIAEST